MSDSRDLKLKFKFTDRGGNEVYDVMQERLHCNVGEQPTWNKVGEARRDKRGKFFTTHGHGTG